MSKNKTKNIFKSKSLIFFVSITLFLLICCILKVNKNTKKFKILAKDKSTKVVLNLEVADNNETRIHGLMGRKSLTKKSGMIFDFNKPGYYSMWMKNTLIPLDMLFINEDNKIISNISDRQPMNEDLINPCSINFENAQKKQKNIDEDYFYEICENKFSKKKHLVRYVIEVPAGTIKEFNIKNGDFLSK